MAHHLYPAALEALAMFQRIVDAGRAALTEPMPPTTRRDMQAVVRKAEAERDRMAHAVEVTARYPNRPPGG